MHLGGCKHKDCIRVQKAEVPFSLMLTQRMNHMTFMPWPVWGCFLSIPCTSICCSLCLYHPRLKHALMFCLHCCCCCVALCRPLMTNLCGGRSYSATSTTSTQRWHSRRLQHWQTRSQGPQCCSAADAELPRQQQVMASSCWLLPGSKQQQQLGSSRSHKQSHGVRCCSCCCCWQ